MVLATGLPSPGVAGGVHTLIHRLRFGRMSVRCLALNASFEPLTMVPVRRALRLVIEGKAEIVESDSGDLVRSERLTLPKPAIIRLVKFVHVPRRFRRQVTNTFLFARDGYRCQYCHRGQSDLRHRECLTRDHLVHLSWAVRRLSVTQAKYIKLFYGDEALRALGGTI
jgi:hypothetical protein